MLFKCYVLDFEYVLFYFFLDIKCYLRKGEVELGEIGMYIDIMDFIYLLFWVKF